MVKKSDVISSYYYYYCYNYHYYYYYYNYHYYYYYYYYCCCCCCYYYHYYYYYRFCKMNQSPFGGIQLIVTGDFFQLPPVEKDKKRFNRDFCFNAR